MLLNSQTNSPDLLEEKIVRCLATKPFQTAKQIHEIVCSRSGRRYSTQAVFKELSKLRAQGVLIHERPYYAISLTWANELGRLVQSVETSSLTSRYLENCLPQTEEKLRWKFRDLFQLKNFWSQLVVLLTKKYPENILLSWNPHPWFYLAYEGHETHLMNALISNDIKMFKIVGGNYPLDLWAKKFWNNEHVQVGFAKSSYQSDRRTYFSAIADHIVTAKLDQRTADRIDDLFKSTESFRQLKPSEVVELLNTPASGVLTVENNPKKFKTHTHRFTQYFGKLKIS
jgi:hypothetical protein